jgi:hypothetical protein
VAIRVEPCGWELDTACCPDWAEAPADRREFVTRVAVELVWRLSGRRFGLCPITVRPCRRRCERPELSGWPPVPGSFWPVLTGGEWVNMTCGRCRQDCSCTELCEVELPGPVDSVTSVQVDDVTLPASAYRVHDHRRLVRVDGGCWPDCQDFTAAPGTDGAFAVTYVQGIPVPPGGRYAAGAYACQLLAACTGGECQLPARVTNIVRQGVSMTLLDPMEFLDKGRTGVAVTDTWLMSVNPYGLREPSRVYSPDVPVPRTVTF